MTALRMPVMAWVGGAVMAVALFAGTAIAEAATISDQYTNIREDGLIFANLCDAPLDDDGSTTTCKCRDSGQCSLAQVIQMFVNVSYLILALSGSAALFAFVYGGFEMILSAGYSERVDRGKKAITGAVIGLGIVFGAYVFINLVLSILIDGTAPDSAIEDGALNDASADTIFNTE